MKQTFILIIDTNDEIEIGQIAVPVMTALRLRTINIEKQAAKQNVQRTVLPRCECGQPAVIDGIQCEKCCHESYIR